MNGAGRQEASSPASSSAPTVTSSRRSSSSHKLLSRCPSSVALLLHSMFMFRSRRNSLLKRLWRLAAGRSAGLQLDEADVAEDHHDEGGLHQQQQVGSGWIKSSARALFKRLTDDQLAALLDVLEGAGASTASSCINIDSDIVHGNCCPVY